MAVLLRKVVPLLKQREELSRETAIKLWV